jgi:hypothetical protein
MSPVAANEARWVGESSARPIEMALRLIDLGYLMWGTQPASASWRQDSPLRTGWPAVRAAGYASGDLGCFTGPCSLLL